MLGCNCHKSCHLSRYTPRAPWPPCTSPESPQFLFLMPLSLNSSLCPALSELRRQVGPTNFSYVWENWVRVIVGACVCMLSGFFFLFWLCIMRSMQWLPFWWVFWFRFDGSHIKEMFRFKPKILLGSVLWFSTFPYTPSPICLFFLHYPFSFSSDSIKPWSVSRCSCTQGCAGKGKDNRNQSEHVGGGTKVLTWGRKKTRLRSNL